MDQPEIPSPPPTLPVITWYLEMRQPPTHPPHPLPGYAKVFLASEMDVEFYRYLYDLVGRDYDWVDRLLMPDPRLREILQNPSTHLSILYDSGEVAGYSELFFAPDGQTELVYFGLAPGFRGKGLGRAFLDWTIAYAWAHGTQRLWVHTCEWDHPAALGTYQKAGFHPYDTQVVQQGLPPDHPRLKPKGSF